MELYQVSSVIQDSVVLCRKTGCINGIFGMYIIKVYIILHKYSESGDSDRYH